LLGVGREQGEEEVVVIKGHGKALVDDDYIHYLDIYVDIQ
jgi:hypothetical protein